MRAVKKRPIFWPKFSAIFLTVSWVTRSTLGFAHPSPVDDLMRPRVEVLSRAPMTLRVTVRPKINMSSATIETPNNALGAVVQCQFGALVADQEYECRVLGSVGVTESALSVVVNGIFVESDGHRHLSSRSLSIANPFFDIEKFRAERRREASEKRPATLIEVIPDK